MNTLLIVLIALAIYNAGMVAMCLILSYCARMRDIYDEEFTNDK